MTRAPPWPWPCFGKLWDGDSTECAGGFDLAYTDDETGSNKRPRCQAFEACRAQKQGDVVTYSPLIQPPQLLRQGQPQHAPKPPPVLSVPVAAPPPYTPYGRPQAQPQPPPPQYPQYQAPQPQQYYPPQQQQHYAPPQMPVLYAPPYAAQYGPTAVPVQHQAYGAHMPAYLAVPEPVESGSWLGRLGAETVRSMGKALGHSLAAFIDHNPFKLHAPPPQVPYMQPPPPPPPAEDQR